MSIHPWAARRITHWRLVNDLVQHPFWRALRPWLPARLRRWARHSFVDRAGRDFRFPRDAVNGLGQRAPAAVEGAADGAISQRPRRVLGRLGGINLHGYFSRWLGLGECARLHAHSLLANGLSVSLHDVDIDVPHARRDHSFSGRFTDRASHPYDLVFVNPDHWEEAMQALVTPTGWRQRYTIGYWFWELEHFPEAWLPCLQKVDEIMVASAYIEQSLRKVTSKTITRMPLPIELGGDSGLSRAAFGLSEQDYLFFFSFDFSSSLARKNPWALIDAFCMAFPRGDEQVSLLIKTSNGDHDVAQLLKLAEAAGRDSRIILRDEMLERVDLQALHRCVDAHVSLHRAEGFGLGMAEAMRLGKPVIATGYSGNLEYMDQRNSCLVDYQLRPIHANEYPYGKGQFWAEPDVAQAASYMQRLYQNPALGLELGERAKLDMTQRFSDQACAAAFARRLRQLDHDRMRATMQMEVG